MEQGFDFSQDEYISVLRSIHREIRHFRFGTKETDLPALIEKPHSVQSEHLLPILDYMMKEKLITEYSCDSVEIHRRIDSAKVLGIDYGLVEPPVEWDIAVWVATGFLKRADDLLMMNIVQEDTEPSEDAATEGNGKKSVVTFSDEFGIFIDGDTKSAYHVQRDSARYHIPRILKKKPGLILREIQEGLPEHAKYGGVPEEQENSVHQAIKKINELFQSQALGKFDLIIPLPTKGYRLNNHDYLFKIDDSGF